MFNTFNDIGNQGEWKDNPGPFAYKLVINVTTDNEEMEQSESRIC